MSSASIPPLVEHVREAMGLRGPGPSAALALDGSMNLLEGVILLLFDDRGPEPSLLVKATDHPDLAPVLAAEHENLQRLRGFLPPAMAGGIPEPLWEGRLSGFYATARRLVPGVTLKNARPSRYFSRRAAATTFRRVSRWLLDFYGASGLVRPGDPEAAEHARDAARRYLSYFIVSDRESALVRESFRRVTEAVARGLPLVPRHGDLCAANVIEAKDGLGIIDWEVPLEPALPLFDLFCFCASTRCLGSRFARTGTHLESFARVFFGDSFLFSASWGVIREHAGALGVAADLLPHLFVTAQAELAVLKYETSVWSHGLSLAGLAGGEESPVARKERFRLVPLGAMDLPLVCIRDGVCETVRLTAERLGRFAGAQP